MQYDDLFNYFDEVRVINLYRRPDRWKRFLKHLPSSWPFRPPVRFAAIDGRDTTFPIHWRESSGAWGCYQSHLAVLKHAIDAELNSVFVLEDDAVFSPNFSREVREFLSHLPDDWELVYFGGQHIELHLGLPSPVNEWVYRPFNANRMHAYAIRGGEALRKIFSFLQDERNWTPLHHVDHFLGEYQKRNVERIYAPRAWLVGQAEGESDIAEQSFGFRPFMGAESIVFPQLRLPMVAVLGPFGGGAGTVAGVLHHLGISMGTGFATPAGTNDRGQFEAADLASMCRRFFAEPWLTETSTAEIRTKLLRIWGACHSQACQQQSSQLAGGMHPTFCLMGHELYNAWEDPFLIVVDRDQQDVVNSLVHRQPDWPIEACLLVTQQLITSREVFLQTTSAPFLRVTYNDLLASPDDTVDNLCTFLDYKPSLAARTSAINSISS